MGRRQIRRPATIVHVVNEKLRTIDTCIVYVNDLEESDSRKGSQWWAVQVSGKRCTRPQDPVLTLTMFLLKVVEVCKATLTEC